MNTVTLAPGLSVGPDKCPISWCAMPMPHEHVQGTCGPMPLSEDR